MQNWKTLELQTNKRYVKYDRKFNSRGIIDFEKGLIIIEAVADKSKPDADQQA